MREIAEASRVAFRRPVFAAGVLAPLALAIGSSTAVFSLTKGVLFNPLPYAQSERLVKLWETNGDRGGAREMTSVSNLADWRAGLNVFEAIAAWQRPSSLTLTKDRPAVEVKAGFVSTNFFNVLAVRPALGRVFVSGDGPDSAIPAVVIGDGFWRRRFGGRENAVGAKLEVEGRDLTIVGIMPRDFISPAGDADLWIPISIRPSQIDRGQNYLQVVARLKPQFEFESAKGNLQAVASDLATRYPATNRNRGLALVPLLEETVSSVRNALLLVMGAVLLVLVIACANVANLFFLRNARGRREIAIRVSLGATAREIGRRVRVEAVLLSSASALAGLPVAAALLSLIRAVASDQIPRLEEIQLDAAALLFACCTAALAALSCGVLPALDAGRGAVLPGLNDGARAIGASRTSLKTRNLLVVNQLALTLMLVAGASILGRSLLKLASVDFGFLPDGVSVVRVSLGSGYETAERKAAYARQTIERLRRIPGVIAAGAATVLPMNSFGIDFDVPYHRLDEAEPARSAASKARFRTASPDYFETMGMTVLRGRPFADSDGASSPRVIVVNRALADRTWPGRDPVGETLRFFWSDWQSYQVIGVVESVRTYGPRSDFRPELFVPNDQNPYAVLNFVLKGAAGETMDASVRAAMFDVDPGQPVNSIVPMRDLVDASVARERFALGGLVGLAALALTLAVVGAYSVMAFASVERHREMGVRVALGARPADILALSLGSAGIMALAGVSLGVAGSAMLNRALVTLLFGVGPLDPSALVGASTLLLAATVGAAWIPARRASRVDPNVTLREN